MALSRTWYTFPNRALDDNTTAAKAGASILFALKSMLMGYLVGDPGGGGVWTLESNSKGSGNVLNTDYSLTPGTDLIGTTFDATKWVYANAGTAHTWFVLKSPAALGPVYLCVDCAGTSTQNVTITASYNAFSTGGTGLNRPTATNEWTHTSFQFMDNTATAHKCHCVRDANGNFWFLTSKNGTGIFHWVLTGQALSGTRSADSYKWITAYHYQGGVARGAGMMGATGCLSNTASLVGGRSYNNGAALLGNSFFLTYSGGVSWESQVSGSNAADATFDFMPGPYLFVNTAGGVGVKGYLPDVNLVGGSTLGTGPAVGGNSPTAASPERAVVGNLLIPYGATPSL